MPSPAPTILLLLVLAGLLTSSVMVHALDNGLARTPPMGWMSWQRYRCETNCILYPDGCISEGLMLRTADRLVADGYRDVGYRYLIVDDCWQEMERDPHTNEIVADKKRFPHGMRHLGKELHARGLLFGVYLDYGTKTCEGFPGSMDFLEVDAASLAKWGADYTKVDGCNSPLEQMAQGYEELGRLLNATGRPMVYSCSYPAYVDWFHNATRLDWPRLRKNCNLSRMWADVQDSWESVVSILAVYEQQGELLGTVAGPGYWNDPDMLLLGNYGLSRDQQRVQMGMWCMLAAPLLISADMATVDEFSAALLKNPLLIAIDQDAGGHQASYIKSRFNVKFWSRPLTSKANSKWAISLVNPVGGGGPIRIAVNLSEFDLQMPQGADPSSIFRLTNVFTRKVERRVRLDEPFDLWVRPTGIEMFLVEQLKPKCLLELVTAMLHSGFD